ncbi:MAG TPA: FlgD immunoglobulin-like domain containing protein [Candidatus Krumholzibacteria bacterium]|nr:FlgD immunoglobulin-like domain containing protein [Candidatus Krumholzibacteria bacterium]HPD70911.1 FlgD immunoglobulin-like domain containing protein [Candidatus Krumholzibacteria bacterium]HRY39389.1 FlgD immunoglobulin-like domain containing protein [Candidatus Krumholzibacteria bacterium]
MMGGRRRRLRIPVLVVLAALGCVAASRQSRADATIQIVNRDAPGEGFNDPAPWTPAGGNPATTLGQARLVAFQHAADVWGSLLASEVTIRIAAQMNPLTCTPDFAVLGSAGPNTVHRNFAGAPRADTWYPQALANALAGTDIAPADSDVDARFNSALTGDAGCLGGAGWYYGLDGNPPAGDYDFITVVLHELGHGLGFITFADLETGAKLQGSDDAYLVHLERAGASPASYADMTDAQRVAANIADPDLRWTGEHTTGLLPSFDLTGGLSGDRVRLHAPDPLAVGSSVAHFTSDVTPDEIMEPVFTGPIHDPGLAIFVLEDVGWPVDPGVSGSFVSVSAAPQDGAVVLSWDFRSLEPIEGFNVYRRAGAAAEVLMNPAGPLDPATQSFLDGGVEPGGVYRYVVAAVRGDGSQVRSGSVTFSLAALPTALAPGRPNPFRAETELAYRIGVASRVVLSVFDPRGRLVRTLVDEQQPPGEHLVSWDGRDDAGRVVPSGAYVVRLTAAATTRSQRLVLLR